MRTDDLDFALPSELIAQSPAPRREDSRLMHYRRAGRAIAHRTFADLPGILRPGDLLVFNDARVLPARFTLQKASGGRVEGLFLAQLAAGQWNVLLKNLGRAAAELQFKDDPQLKARVIERGEAGQFLLEVSSEEPAMQILSRLGRMPLPPYIRRERDHDERDEQDRERYQTVFARSAGAVAAPTAALHFSDALFDALASRGIEKTFVTLHVGLGTFKPVTADALEDHAMHTEAYSIEPAAADALNRAKNEGRRIIAVGTTSARVLESQPPDAPFAPQNAQTGIFIHPPYRWRHVDALITNFHLPRSTLIALVAALTGLEEQRRLYQVAIKERYRFFSYGDAILIE